MLNVKPQMIWVTSRAADYYHWRAPFVAVGFGFEILGFAMLLGSTPAQHSLRYGALVFATIGSASESSRFVRVELAIC